MCFEGGSVFKPFDSLVKGLIAYRTSQMSIRMNANVKDEFRRCVYN